MTGPITLAMLGDRVKHLRAELERIRAAGTDPRLLRWCSWPGCLSSFDASTGPRGGGWKQYRHMAVLLCPAHTETGHWPSYEMDRDDLTRFVARCGCGETGEVRPSNWEAVYVWWERHLADYGILAIAPQSAGPFPLAEIEPAEIAEDVEALARHSARLREAEERNGMSHLYDCCPARPDEPHRADCQQAPTTAPNAPGDPS